MTNSSENQEQLSRQPGSEKPILYCSAATAGEWVKAFNDPELKTNDLDRLHRYLGEVLRTEYLNVLSGAGSSMGVWDKRVKSKEHVIEPTRAGLWKEAERLLGSDIQDLLSKVKYNSDKYDKDVEHLLSQCHLAEAFVPQEDVATFVKQMEIAIVNACRFVNDDTALGTHELFLRKAARRSRRLPRLRVFTTNYDLCFERAAQRAKFVVVDGFSHTYPQEFDSSYYSYDFVRRSFNDEAPDYIPNVFHLYKLHGSVDWCRVDGQVIRVAIPDNPLLIYPRSSKYESSYEHPFIETMGYFQNSLRKSNNAFVVVGYGFADNHLTQPIVSAIRSNVSMRLVVVDPMLSKNNASAAIKWLKELIKAGDSRICLVNGTFDEFVRVLPDPDVASEEELHVERLRRLKK